MGSLTGSLTSEILTLFREASRSHARTLALPAEARASLANAVDSGATWQGSLAKYDLQSRGWKTHQHSLYGGLIEFAETWPRWGMMLDGELYPLPTPSGLEEHRAWIISESASGLSLPTVTKMDFTGRGYQTSKGKNFFTLPGILTEAVVPEDLEEKRKEISKRLGTPTARDWKDGTAEACKNTPENGLLGRQIHRLPTLTKFDATCGDLEGKEYDGKTTHAMKLIQGVKRFPSVRTQSPTGGGSGLDGGSGARSMMSEEDRKSLTGGSLNPEWTEWFMGFPIGWSALAPLETARFRQWWRSHGGYSIENSNLPNPVSPA